MGGELFSRNVPGTTETLARARIGIAGCGGIGSNAAVALARAGVGALILVDHDVVEESNLNRQYFLRTDIGVPKAEALAAHLRSINPDVSLDVRVMQLSPANVAEVFADADILIEAFDRADGKQWLIERWCVAHPGRPIVVGNGLSGRGRLEDLVVRRSGMIHFCGDGRTDMSMGLCAPRVAIVANMQASVAIDLLLDHRMNLSRSHGDTEMHENEIGTAIADCAVKLHQDLGPGLLETVYEVTLANKLEARGFSVQRQVAVAIAYDGQEFDEGFRADLVIEGKVIVELKSLEKVHPAHKKQLLTYLRLTGLKLGYLLNFGEALMKDGITRTINGQL